ncbi:hypothetical protein [Tissierella praeacuta]|uniref:hypothetical protein n=1 Tax=Tissierella praeacuta TaxID=43131 RepID=UPI00333F0094
MKELFLKHNCKSKESFNSNFTSSEVVIVFDVELKALNINYKFKKVYQIVNKDIVRIIPDTSYDFMKSTRKGKYIVQEFRIKERIAVL